jgi:hypothetical protein
MAYLLLCDVMFWRLASWFCTCIFSKHLCFSHLWVFASLLSGFCCSLSWAAVEYCTLSLEVRWLIVCIAPRPCSNSSIGFGTASTIIHRPTQVASFGGTTCSLCLVLYAIMFLELCFNFMWSVSFSLSRF